MIDFDAIAHDPRLAPYYGWHEEQNTQERPQYLPAIQQFREEFMAFVDIASELGAFKDQVLLLGLGLGGAMHAMFNRLSKGCVTVDHDRGVVDRYMAAIGPENGRIICGDARSIDTRNAASSYGPYSLLFIDADHSYQSVCADIAEYTPLIPVGGLVAIHDVNETHYPGVVQAVRELNRPVDIVNPHFLGIGWFIRS